MNLLLVEDDAATAGLLAAELRALDHRVVVAAQGDEALLAVERDGFDAVILDRMLPRMDGATVVRRLRERGKTLPVLMLSALGRSDEKVSGLDAGADDDVVKPTPAVAATQASRWHHLRLARWRRQRGCARSCIARLRAART